LQFFGSKAVGYYVCWVIFRFYVSPLWASRYFMYFSKLDARLTLRMRACSWWLRWKLVQLLPNVAWFLKKRRHCHRLCTWQFAEIRKKNSAPIKKSIFPGSLNDGSACLTKSGKCEFSNFILFIIIFFFFFFKLYIIL